MSKRQVRLVGQIPSDLGVPVVGVGLLYQQGYFRQVIDVHGEQTEFFPYNEPSRLPVMPATSPTGEWIRIRIDFPGGPVWLRVWEAKVGRVDLYLLDSNDAMNSPADRGITSELYGGGAELRLQQEMVLGIGGWRLLEALGIDTDVCHLNEGHAALAVIERARSFMLGSHQSFEVALAATRAGNIFTTHTPVEAGFDRFSPELVEHYLGRYANELGIGTNGLLSLGRADLDSPTEPLNMAYLAVRGSCVVNAVSQLHGEVSRRIFQPLFAHWPEREVPITHVTNGVHVPSWESEAADSVWTEACGQDRWFGTMDTIAGDFKTVSDDSLWQLRSEQSRQMIAYVRERRAQQLTRASAPEDLIRQCSQLLDPNVLTIGFARRFTEYKRPNLLLHDPDRLARIISHSRWPVQLVVAGKAHPRDEEGKAMVREWWEFSLRAAVRNKVIILADYDMALAKHLVQGVDLWINTPRRPWEACGTSGMKVLVGGGLNLSEKDGWWAEAFKSEVGWAIGDGREHTFDPGWDGREAEELYHVLENEVIPCFYERDAKGIPVGWVARMRSSMAELTPQYSAHRMLQQYVDRIYAAAEQSYSERIADGAQEALHIVRWQQLLHSHWQDLHFGRLDITKEGDSYIFSVAVYLAEVDVGSVQVQLYAEPLEGNEPEIHVMDRTGTLSGAVGGYHYQQKIRAVRPARDYTPRIVPHFDGATIPMEASHICWFEGTRSETGD